MKVVINKCWGGFSLSPLAVERLAELNGRKCYFYMNPRDPLDIHKLLRASREEAENGFMWFAYDVPDADKYEWSPKNWHELSQEERQRINDEANSHSLDNRTRDRSNAALVQVVEELGEKANGRHAKLAIVEIPNGVEYDIDEYDGMESIHEIHRSWA